jgi:HEAT repeat protein
MPYAENTVRIGRRDAKAWFDQHAGAFADFHAEKIDAETWWKLRVQAEHGLIRCGNESVPFAVEMLHSRDPDIREDGAGVLAALGKVDGVIDALVGALEAEAEDQPRDAMIEALGRLKNRRAIPYLAQVIRNPDTDGDTRWTAVEALGRIVRHRFDRQPDALEAAGGWLDSHGF